MGNTNDTAAVVENIKYAMESRLFADAFELSGETGIEHRTLERLLDGERGVSHFELDLLADALDTSVHWLLTGEPDPSKVVIVHQSTVHD